MKLIAKQIELLGERFFTSQATGFPGVARIANELLVTGSCIVAGDGRIWHGGVGNFIRAEPAPNAVGCSLMRLDLKGFLSSSWVQDHITFHALELRSEIEDRKDTLKALLDLRGTAEYL